MRSLRQEVLDIIEEESEGEDRRYMEEVMDHGCVSGVVSALIYYDDTEEFFKEHEKEINGWLQYMFEVTGFTSPVELFGGKWDEEDPLAYETHNQNLLAWFAFEEEVRAIYEEEYGAY